jgi:hypothetical protein
MDGKLDSCVDGESTIENMPSKPLMGGVIDHASKSGEPDPSLVDVLVTPPLAWSTMFLAILFLTNAVD